MMPRDKPLLTEVIVTGGRADKLAVSAGAYERLDLLATCYLGVTTP
jgi:hypothetical protein